MKNRLNNILRNIDLDRNVDIDIETIKRNRMVSLNWSKLKDLEKASECIYLIYVDDEYEDFCHIVAIPKKAIAEKWQNTYRKYNVINKREMNYTIPFIHLKNGCIYDFMKNEVYKRKDNKSKVIKYLENRRDVRLYSRNKTLDFIELVIDIAESKNVKPTSIIGKSWKKPVIVELDNESYNRAEISTQEICLYYNDLLVDVYCYN